MTWTTTERAETLFGDAGTVLLAVEGRERRAELRMALEDRGCCVLEASSDQEALSLSASCPETIDLLMAEWDLPGLGGRGLAHRVERGRQGMRVLMVRRPEPQPGETAAGDPRLRADVLAAQASRLLVS